jgi:hypothetical protein
MKSALAEARLKTSATTKGHVGTVRTIHDMCAGDAEAERAHPFDQVLRERNALPKGYGRIWGMRWEAAYPR